MGRKIEEGILRSGLIVLGLISAGAVYFANLDKDCSIEAKCGLSRSRVTHYFNSESGELKSEEFMKDYAGEKDLSVLAGEEFFIGASCKSRRGIKSANVYDEKAKIIGSYGAKGNFPKDLSFVMERDETGNNGYCVVCEDSKGNTESSGFVDLEVK